MSGFTPGPWRVEQDTTLVWGDCNPDDHSTYGMGYPIAGARVTLGRGRNAGLREDEGAANARLIAAAPALFAELERLVTALEPLERNGGWPLDHAGVATLNGARAALAAVKGEKG